MSPFPYFVYSEWERVLLFVRIFRFRNLGIDLEDDVEPIPSN